MTPRLTVVMPLKGRSLFTLRLLTHANKVRMPYRFLIADGRVNEPIARHLEDSATTFPHLDIEYVRYPDDASYRHFFLKMADALTRVRTRYAMVADNDDFLGVNGIEQALDFLDANPEYVCARGQVAAFSVYSGPGNPSGGVHGRLDSLLMRYECRDLSQPLAADRLRHGGLSHLIYYGICRSEALATVWREAAEINFSDLMLHEVFHAMRPLTLGKVRTNRATITYFAQIGASLSSDPLRDWVSQFLRSTFTSDVREVVERIAAATAAADGTDQAAVAEQVRESIEAYFRAFLTSHYSLKAQIKRALRRNWPNLVHYIKARPRRFAGRARAAVLAQLRSEGATAADIERCRQEILQIEATLSPRAYEQFAAPFLAMARVDDTRVWV